MRPKNSVTLAGARVSAGLTQTELADKLSVSKQTVLMWERGKRTPRPYVVESIASICGFSADNIFLQ